MRQEPTAIQQRVLEAMKGWDSDRLRSELSLMILTDSDASLSEQFFDDIATEEEAEAGVLEGLQPTKVYVSSDKQEEFDANFEDEDKFYRVATEVFVNAPNEAKAELYGKASLREAVAGNHPSAEITVEEVESQE